MGITGFKDYELGDLGVREISEEGFRGLGGWELRGRNYKGFSEFTGFRDLGDPGDYSMQN